MMKPFIRFSRTIRPRTLEACIVLLIGGLFTTDGATQAISNQGAPSHSWANPWGPSANTSVTPLGGAPVSFKSGVQGAGGLAIPGVLFKPGGTAKGAVVVVSGGNGWSDSREGHYGRSMSSAGFAVLVIETNAPRGVKSTVVDNAAVSMFDQLQDAHAARRFLVDAGYRSDRIAIMGVGRGGAIALMAADKTFDQGQSDKRFALAMAVTPTCILRPRSPKPGAVIFLGLAEKDSLHGVQGCQDLAREFAAAGGKIVSKVYPGTASGFDGEPSVLRMVHDPRAENLTNCRVVIEMDGRATIDGNSFSSAEFAALIAHMRKSCMSRGAFGYTNLTQKANLTLDVIDFLDTNFAQ